APGNDSGTGAAYVFTRSGTTWTEQPKLTASDGANSDLFGAAVAVNGDTAIVGAYQKNAQTGAAYIFTRSGTTWTEQQALTASDGAGGDVFGYSVSVSGDTAIVGAYTKNTGRGAAYVFTRSGITWTEQQKLTASDAATFDYFGFSVGVSGDTAI